MMKWINDIRSEKMLKKIVITSMLAAVSLSPTLGATKPVTTDTGLQYTDVKPGNGQTPKRGQVVIVHYTGTLTDGKQFDSSQGRDPLKFTLGEGQVIQGWDEGISTMKVGGKRQLVIPASLGYGAQGMGGVIPPNATLHFDVELIGVEGKGSEGKGSEGSKS
jgi:peptidylprolyl isomerase